MIACTSKEQPEYRVAPVGKSELEHPAYDENFTFGFLAPLKNLLIFGFENQEVESL